MTRILSVILSLALAGVLAACGGGGGGGDPPIGPPPNPIVFTVKVNNVPLSASSASNAVVIASGDTITVTSSVPVTWVPTITGALVTNLASTATTWTARIAKFNAAAATYVLGATNGTIVNSLNINIPAGDTRNGKYKLFSTDANEYELIIDFDLRQFTLRTAAGVGVASNNFSGPVDGTYYFKLTDFVEPPGLNARFRIEHGIIVGAYPLGGSLEQPRPFIAANHFVTSAADVPVTNMWMFASDNAPADSPPINSRVQSIRLVGNQIAYCSVAVGAITTVANCLPANLSVYTLTFNENGSMTWLDNGVPVNLYLVRAGTELILVRAQSYPTGTGNKRFEIALDDARAVDNIVYEGGVSNGSWGTTTVAASFSRVATIPGLGFLPDNVAGTLATINQAQPLRGVTATTDGVNYFVLGTGVLGADIAARGSAKAGQISFGLRR